MTVALAACGPYAVAGLLHGLAALETLGAGAIGGFAVLAAMTPDGQVVYAETQTQGSQALDIDPDWLAFQRAALISSGPHRPEPLRQFLPAADGVGLVTGHRLPNRPFQNSRLNLQVLDYLQQGLSPQAAITRVLSQAPEADAGLMAIDAQGRLAWANSARVRRRADLMTAERHQGAWHAALMMNSIFCLPPLHQQLAQIILDIVFTQAACAEQGVAHPWALPASAAPNVQAQRLPIPPCRIQPSAKDRVVVDTTQGQIALIESADPNIIQADGRWTIIQHGTPVVDQQNQPLGAALHDVISTVSGLHVQADSPLAGTHHFSDDLIFGTLP